MNEIRISGKIIHKENHPKNKNMVIVILEKLSFVDCEGEKHFNYYFLTLNLLEKNKYPNLKINGYYEIIGELWSNYSEITNEVEMDDGIEIIVNQIERVVKA